MGQRSCTGSGVRCRLTVCGTKVHEASSGVGIGVVCYSRMAPSGLCRTGDVWVEGWAGCAAGSDVVAMDVELGWRNRMSGRRRRLRVFREERAVAVSTQESREAT